jgi:hypothetical protein
MKTSKKIQLAVLVALSQVQFIAAQTPGFDDDVQDVPINEYMPLLIIAGIVLAYGWLRKPKPVE